MFNGNSGFYKYLERLKEDIIDSIPWFIWDIFSGLCFGIGFWIAYQLINYIYG